jgi:hypothetical protein
MKSITLLLVMVAGVAGGAQAEQFRTDINPALQYYQAFVLAPDLSQADRDYLFTNEWRGQKLPERFGELVGRYNNQFTLVRHAAFATVPCDWGVDMSPGPATLLPGLARNKVIVQTSRLRTMWFLQHGQQGEAVDDLLAAFALARNVSRDGTLISVLVQIASENILYAAVAENYYQLTPETLKQIADGFDAAPERGTVIGCIGTEKAFFHDWLKTKILDLRKENGGDEVKVMAALRDVVEGMQGGEGDKRPTQPSFWDRVEKTAGGTSEGVLTLVRDQEPFYERLLGILALPQHAYEMQIKAFNEAIQNSPNPFVPEMFSAWEKCRTKEYASLVRLAMVRAATEYKLHGEEGLKSAPDPYSQLPFGFERFVFEGVDRGFELKSAYAGRGAPEVLIFVEKDGPPFSVSPKIENKAVAPSSTSR